jgi:hypothetical protein
VAVIASSAAEHKNQDNNQYQHSGFPSSRGPLRRSECPRGITAPETAPGRELLLEHFLNLSDLLLHLAVQIL